MRRKSSPRQKNFRFSSSQKADNKRIPPFLRKKISPQKTFKFYSKKTKKTTLFDSPKDQNSDRLRVIQMTSKKTSPILHTNFPVGGATRDSIVIFAGVFVYALRSKMIVCDDSRSCWPVFYFSLFDEGVKYKCFCWSLEKARMFWIIDSIFWATNCIFPATEVQFSQNNSSCWIVAEFWELSSSFNLYQILLNLSEFQPNSRIFQVNLQNLWICHRSLRVRHQISSIYPISIENWSLWNCRHEFLKYTSFKKLVTIRFLKLATTNF